VSPPLTQARPAGIPGLPAHVQIHERALVESMEIGSGTRVWAFAHVMAGARIGCDCNICDHTFIESEVLIGDRVTIKSGVYLWDGITIEDDVFIGPQATFTNDLFPRSRQPFTAAPTRVRQGASIGAGAVILPGITIGPEAMVGAGSVVVADVPGGAVVAGNPARRLRGVSDSPSR
jgi:UDP-2-acetamido-3-amino-2,3-dideoxy-glucuronate N-acetyltransferase